MRFAPVFFSAIDFLPDADGAFRKAASADTFSFCRGRDIGEKRIGTTNGLSAGAGARVFVSPRSDLGARS